MSGGNGETKARKSTAKSRVRRVLIVDDHPMMRRGLAELIGQEGDLGICGEADSAEAAMLQVRRTSPDLAIVDISLGDGSGIELIKQLKARDPGLRVLVCSMHDEKLYAERALRAGALGYLNKSEAPDRVIDAIRQVLRGKVYLSNEMSDRLLRRMQSGEAPEGASPIERLTDRELEVFELLGQGLSTREIAERLSLSIKTIDAHRQKIKSKLELHNANELVQHAVKWTLERA